MQLDRLDHFPADIARITPREIKQVFSEPYAYFHSRRQA